MTTYYRIGPTNLVPLARGRLPPFTDPMSNAVVLNYEFLGQIILDETQEGALPLSDGFMRVFLHEVTHYATFAGKVGAARSALATSVAARGSVGGHPTDSNDLWLAQRDDLILRFFVTLTEPLVEGVALFAEHDAQWSPLPFASAPLLHLEELFLRAEATSEAVSKDRNLDGGPDERESEGLASRYNQAINARLKRARSSNDWIGDKARLLRQPLLGVAGGPAYLLGYLATKRAYLVLRRINTALAESDLFLLLMLDYWFGSDELTLKNLVSISDSNTAQVQVTIGSLVERFQDQWDTLYRAPSRVLHGLPSRLLKGAVSSEAIDEVSLGIGLRTAADATNVFVPSFLKHRLVLRLGFIRVDVVSNTGTAIVHEANTRNRILECPLAPLADSGEYPGSLELIRSFDREITALVVLGPTGTVAIRELNSLSWNTPPLLERFDDLVSIEMVEAAGRSYSESMFARSWETEDLAPMNEDLMKQAAAIRNSTFLQIALPGAREPERDRALDLLESAGLSAVFGEGSTLEEVARLSLLFGGNGASIDEVACNINRSEHEVESLLRSLNSDGMETLGVELFEIEDGFACSAI